MPISRCSGSSWFVVLTPHFRFWTSRILSPIVPHVPEFFCQDCWQIDIQRSGFSQRALDMHLLKAQDHRPSIGQYIGPDNRCPVSHVTFALRYLAVAHASHAKPRSGAISFVPLGHFCPVPLRRSWRTPSSLSSLRPVGFALWLGKWESLMFDPWVAQSGNLLSRMSKE